MASAPEDLINQAIVELGYAKRIASIFEGSKASKGALEIYRECRDEVLAEQNWPFARSTNIPLILLKGPPPPGGFNPTQQWTNAYAPPGWLYEYAYPENCIMFRSVTRPPRAMFNVAPRFDRWREDTDKTLAPPVRVILTDVKGALAVFTARVTDPTTFSSDFTRTLVERLASRLAIWLTGSAEVAKGALAESTADSDASDHRPGG